MANKKTTTSKKELRDDGTRTRIKVAARKLFAERGVEAVSVRDIISEAGAKNGGSLNYHFKSKDALVAELIADIFREASDSWLDGLSELNRNGGPKSVREIVRIIVRWPDPKFLSDPSPTAARFLTSALFTRRRKVRELLTFMNFSVFGRMLDHIVELSPEIPSAVIRQRLIFFAWYVASAKSAHEAYLASNRRYRIWTDFDPLRNIVDTATAMIEAPVFEAMDGEKSGDTNKSDGKSATSTVLNSILPH